jgi:hypothetical protein
MCAIIPGPALSQEGEAGRTTNLVVYGNDPCPKSEEGEVVVCARRPEGERYRIPKALRENKEDRGEMSWGARVNELDEASRPSRPGSCSAVGSFGQTGCFEQMIRNWRADRNAAQREAAQIP